MPRNLLTAFMMIPVVVILVGAVVFWVAIGYTAYEDGNYWLLAFEGVLIWLLIAGVYFDITKQV